MVLLVLLLIIVPIIELAIIIQVGSMIGIWWTIGLLVADSLFGAWLLMREGSRSWLRFRAALGNGKIPAKETADGGLVISGGALLLTPGFLTDIFGLLLLFQPTRDIVRRVALTRAVSYAATSVGGPAGWTLRGAFFGSRAAKYARSKTPRRDYDVEGTATEVKSPPPALP
ncbi:unannotated protein [freshwater metagenome]|uniref:Unannotated protein n=1 Tax=freshwater metagenome TaxID=449393 RepID=A0A6J7RS22_9ZZZZ|nr:FxsA family protein [Actinomycetota bacterium]